MNDNLPISEEIIAQVYKAAIIEDVIRDRVKLEEKGRYYWGLCPFHHDNTPCLAVDPVRHFWHCFGCGAGGSVVDFLMLDQGLSFSEAVRDLARRYGIEIPEPERSPEEIRQQESKSNLLRVLSLANRFFTQNLSSPAAGQARDYLTKRGLLPEVWADFDLGFALPDYESLGRFLTSQKIPEKLGVEAGLLCERDKGSGCYDRFRERIIFPIRDADNNIVSFGGRILDANTPEGNPKYLHGPTTEVFQKSNILYNLVQARRHMRQKRRVLVVEGYFDVITLHAHGFKETVGTLGTALTLDHIRMLHRNARRIILLFDGDLAGQKAAVRTLPFFLEEDIYPQVLTLPKTEDPDSFVRKRGGEQLEQALGLTRPLLEVVLDNVVRQGDLSSPEGQSRILDEAAHILIKIKDQTMRTKHVRRLCETLNLPLQIIADRCRLLRQSQKRT